MTHTSAKPPTPAKITLPHGHADEPSVTIIDLTSITTPFGLLDADTQEALRAHGGPYEAYGYLGWKSCDPRWKDHMAYRVKPKPPEPVVEEVVLYGGKYIGTSWDFESASSPSKSWHRHRITLKIIDGVVQPQAEVVKL